MTDETASFRYDVNAEWEQLPAGIEHKDMSAVGIDSQDRVYLLTRFDPNVLVYEPDGSYITTWGGEVFTGPHGLSVGPDDSVYCVDNGDHTVRKFPRTASCCTNLAIAADGRIYVADGYGNCRIHVFAPTGELIRSWGEVGIGPGQFHLPHGIAIGPDGRVHVCDRENDRIQVFDGDGRYLTEWTDVQRPCQIAIEPSGAGLLHRAARHRRRLPWRRLRV